MSEWITLTRIRERIVLIWITIYKAEGSIMQPEGAYGQIMSPMGGIMWPVGGTFSLSRGQGWHINIITCKGKYPMSFAMALGTGKQTPFWFWYFPEKAWELHCPSKLIICCILPWLYKICWPPFIKQLAESETSKRRRKHVKLVLYFFTTSKPSGCTGLPGTPRKFHFKYFLRPPGAPNPQTKVIFMIFGNFCIWGIQKAKINFFRFAQGISKYYTTQVAPTRVDPNIQQMGGTMECGHVVMMGIEIRPFFEALFPLVIIRTFPSIFWALPRCIYRIWLNENWPCGGTVKKISRHFYLTGVLSDMFIYSVL